MNILVRDSEPEDTLTNVGFKLGRWLDTIIKGLSCVHK